MSGGLLRRPGAGRIVHRLTPQDAGWTYVGFEVLRLAPGETAEGIGEGRELCLVLVAGRVQIRAGEVDFGPIGERLSPFAGAPFSVYVPPALPWSVRAVTACEIAVCSAPAEGRFPPRLIAPGDCGQEQRGKGTNLRHVRNILPDIATAEGLLVVEVITPGGHWSSYPPHKHDTDDPPRETYLEETYYHRLARPDGFAVQRVYTDDRTLDETMAVGDRDLVLVPRGYHPVGAPHGFDLYYLNVMAGPVRQWKFTIAAEYAFLGW